MSRADPEPTLQDEAARAGWLYYVGGLTQDQIASELGVSRQRAQRLVSRAMADGLIQVRLNHRIGACLDLEAALRDRFRLTRCRVVPGLGPGADPVRAIAPAAAAELERFLRMPDPLVIGLGTGRAMRGMVDAMGPMDAPQHRLVSLIGNIAPDGSASFFDVVMRIADKVRAPHYPMPVPVISPTPAEKEAFHALAPVRKVAELARAADVIFVGVGQMGGDAPLLADGFVTAAELTQMVTAGAAGEVAGWVFDSQGQYLNLGTNDRTGGVRVEPELDRPSIGVAAGASKVPAILGALKSRILNGLITDEATAAALLSKS
ncbi:sugar-binding transcriptional regulator [Gemmobacter fulvus]|uniref:Sugar-binding transcriptional regulator n=1 Tax=Gemmobacter fulvus TaxID=2840474 RepID=A0A975P7J0_9RHOB|nr:sugar-binding transcriptional regulator [Gemmobacter fulvus]MBT9245204.1 sugar-binding transcriptional regulator [Gemmobacter fulvus]MDQ1848072.1 sugar-binding transcriptional regulator [Gemmobacter fulvus]QWK90463.1 sugar-binding transcriptional regulator [Gemmobacter fulvus]